MTDDRQRRSPIVTILACIFGAIALYVLSAGPASRIALKTMNAGGRFPRSFELVYGPLIWLHKNTMLHDPLEWYIEVWLPSEEPDSPAR